MLDESARESCSPGRRYSPSIRWLLFAVGFSVILVIAIAVMYPSGGVEAFLALWFVYPAVVYPLLRALPFLSYLSLAPHGLVESRCGIRFTIPWGDIEWLDISHEQSGAYVALIRIKWKRGGMAISGTSYTLWDTYGRPADQLRRDIERCRAAQCGSKPVPYGSDAGAPELSARPTSIDFLTQSPDEQPVLHAGKILNSEFYRCAARPAAVKTGLIGVGVAVPVWAVCALGFGPSHPGHLLVLATMVLATVGWFLLSWLPQFSGLRFTPTGVESKYCGVTRTIRWEDVRQIWCYGVEPFQRVGLTLMPDHPNATSHGKGIDILLRGYFALPTEELCSRMASYRTAATSQGGARLRSGE